MIARHRHPRNDGMNLVHLRLLPTLLLLLLPDGRHRAQCIAQMIGPDESSLSPIVSAPDSLLLQDGIVYYDPATSMAMTPLRIRSDVPVTIQRYDDVNTIIGVDPINVGELLVVVTSDCDTSQTTIVPKVEWWGEDDSNITLVEVMLGDGVKSDMPFLKSSSYESVFYENSYIQFTSADIMPDDPIIRNVPCMTENECRDASAKMGIKSNYFNVGEYATSGCFYKNDKAYWSTTGDPEVVETAGVLQQRLYCKEVYYIDDVDVVVDDVVVDTDGGTCTTKEQCDARRSELGIANFFSGTFPTKGCFSKDGNNGVTAYWSDGGSEEDMSNTALPALQRRITCDEVVVDADGDVCTTQEQCDKKRLDLGIETFVAGIFPTKGCFSKAGSNGVVAYWSDGGTSEEMSTIDLPGVQERIACEGTSTSPPACESGPMADPAKSCTGGRFCKLDTGVCNAKIGVFTGVCAVKPDMCIEVYDPVCGCDETTYSNECFAHGEGISVSRVGECEEEVFTASQAIAHGSSTMTSGAFSVKSFVFGSIMSNVVSSHVMKSPRTSRSRLLQDTCTYNVEILLNGCYAGASAQVEVAAPKARVINSVMEIVETETVAVYESSSFEGTQFYGKEFKHTATLAFPDDQEQLILAEGNIFVSVPPLDEGTCIPIVVGRPFIDSNGHSLVASSVPPNVCSETSSWLGETSVSAIESESMASAVNMTDPFLSLGGTWTRNALGEHASVASFAAFSIALMTNNAPSDLIEDSLKAALDEVRHAKTSFAIASKLLGKDVTPGPLPPSNHQFKGDLTALAMAVAKEGCVDETLSALAAAADAESIDEVLENGAADGTKYYGIGRELLVWIRDELRTISMDESNHSALAWRTLDWVCRVDANACDATEQSVLDESKLVEAFHRRFGRNVEYSPQVLERMILTWRNIYTSRGVPPINIGSGYIGVVVEEATGHHASKPLFESLLVDNISRV